MGMKHRYQVPLFHTNGEGVQMEANGRLSGCGECVRRAWRDAVGRLRSESGQMTLEMAVALPVLIVVAVIAVNAMTFFGDCAVFDRVAHEAVRVHATAPAYQQTGDESCALIEQSIRAQMDASNLEVTVERSATGVDLDAFTMTLGYHPTLFGRGLRPDVFGVSLPPLTHTTRYVVDSYKPGVMA